MNSDIQKAAEAILLVAERPIDTGLLADLLDLEEEKAELLCEGLAAAYTAADHGFTLARVAGGWRFQTRPEVAPWVERYVLEGQTSRLSAAALETLAIIAYKQPLSRAQIAAIRGVNVDGVVRTLIQRGYLAEVGRDAGPGQATLYGTTETFLEKLCLDTLDDLPALGDFVPGADVVEALERGLMTGVGDRADAGTATDAGSPDGAGQAAESGEAAGEGDAADRVEVAESGEAAGEGDAADRVEVAEPGDSPSEDAAKDGAASGASQRPTRGDELVGSAVTEASDGSSAEWAADASERDRLAAADGDAQSDAVEGHEPDGDANRADSDEQAVDVGG